MVVVSLALTGCEFRLRCIAWLPYVLVRFPKTVGCCAERRLSGSGGERLLALWVEVLPKLPCIVFRIIFRVSQLRWWDFVCPQGREVGFISRTLWALPDGSLVSAMGVWLVVLLWNCQSHLVVSPCVWKRLVVRVLLPCFLLVVRGDDAPLWCCVAKVRIVATFWWSHLPLGWTVACSLLICFWSRWWTLTLCLASVVGVWLAMPPMGVLALRCCFLFRVRRRPVVCLLPMLSVGCSGWWWFHMAFGAMSCTMATFVAKGRGGNNREVMVRLSGPLSPVVFFDQAWHTDLSGCRSAPWGHVLVTVWAAVTLRWRGLLLVLLRRWILVAPAADRVRSGSVGEELGGGLWATPGCSIPAVCLPADVATAVRIATSEEASPWSDVTLSRHGWPSR
ncbi:hypothetical protein Taro_053618 [Colocasia esculenta]|uniref:Uncharacterized protein n=1 Tax=Colocasia esculenta TaxID=4460 RepID=A0A843XLM8_COLES|nr:hypothetical protein [Colocasia esculenta]